MSGKRPFGVQLTCFVGTFPEAHWDHMNKLRHLYETEYEPVLPSEHEAYGRHIDRLWRKCAEARVDLLVVEPDIWPEQKDLDAMRECDDVYCAAIYHLGGASYDHALGFTRFRWQLMTKDPDLIERAAHRNTETGAGPDKLPWHWQRMDMRIDHQVMEDHGYVACKHDPVRHSHDYPMKDPLFPNNEGE